MKLKDESVREFAKAAEIGVVGVLLPLLLRDLTSLPVPTANGTGIFIALIIAYWLPPESRVSLVKWISASCLLAVATFLFSKCFW